MTKLLTDNGFEVDEAENGADAVSKYQNEKPDLVLVYGDTNSTLAGALAASKLLIPVAHVEAGLRSFNMTMPEEQNRILTDHISKYLFAPTETAIQNLSKEGIIENVHNVGDIMYDAILDFSSLAKQKSNIISKLGLEGKEYILATIHRAENTNDPIKLKNIINAFNKSGKKVILPLHPRTKKYISEYKLEFASNVKVIDPVGYLDMIMLEMGSGKIVTDSGGVQKEAFFLSKPCITMRNETEWIETVDNGWNVLVGTDSDKICYNILNFAPKEKKNNYFGDGNTAQKIVQILNAN